LGWDWGAAGGLCWSWGPLEAKAMGWQGWQRCPAVEKAAGWLAGSQALPGMGVVGWMYSGDRSRVWDWKQGPQAVDIGLEHHF